MPHADSESPVRSDDGQWIHFTGSVREYRDIAITYTIVAFAIPAIGILATALFGGADQDRLLDPDFYFGRFGLIMLVPVVLIVLPSWLIWLWKCRQPPSTKVAIGRVGIYLPLRAEQVIPWSAVERIVLAEHFQRSARTNVSLSLHVTDRPAFGYRGSQTVRAFSQRFYGSDVTEMLEHLVGEPEDVLAALREFAPEHLTAGLHLSS